MCLSVVAHQESPLQAEVAALLRESDTLAAALYPGAYRRPIVTETLASPDILFFVARVDGIVAGCCALLVAGDGSAELKRMIVGAGFRGQGVGVALLRAAEATAVTHGLDVVRMEVGVRNTAGQALYRRFGYSERGPFPPYGPSPISLFLEKRLAGAASPADAIETCPSAGPSLSQD
jgi:putative acetyltransferase